MPAWDISRCLPKKAHRPWCWISAATDPVSVSPVSWDLPERSSSGRFRLKFHRHLGRQGQFGGCKLRFELSTRDLAKNPHLLLCWSDELVVVVDSRIGCPILMNSAACWELLWWSLCAVDLDFIRILVFWGLWVRCRCLEVCTHHILLSHRI